MIDKKIRRKDFHILANHFIGSIAIAFSLVYLGKHVKNKNYHLGK
jgi:hypothetical protein